MNRTFKGIAGLVSSRWKEASVCEACGNTFTCGATLAGCWCADLDLTSEEREQLRGRYQNCLCRACLEKARTVPARDITA